MERSIQEKIAFKSLHKHQLNEFLIYLSVEKGRLGLGNIDHMTSDAISNALDVLKSDFL